MSFHPQAHSTPEKLRRDICRADAVSAVLASAVLDLAFAPCAAPNRAHHAQRVRELIGAQAWTDAALALVELNPSRVVRRLSHDDGEWCCIIGSHWPMPEWLDDTVEFGHAELPLAILGALIESLRERSVATPATTSVPRSRSDLRDAITCVDCGNFA